MKNRGSFTVEAIIIVPLVFYILLMLIFLSLILYQQVFVNAVAQKASENGAATWKMVSKDLFYQQIQIKDFEESNLYWRIVDFDKKQKFEKVKEYIIYNLDNYSLYKTKKENCTIDISLDDYVIYKKLNVKVTHKYKLPIGTLLSKLGLTGNITLTSYSQSVINEPAEFIRNIDFAVDTITQIDESTGGNLEKIKKYFSDTYETLTTKLSKFLN